MGQYPKAYITHSKYGVYGKDTIAIIPPLYEPLNDTVPCIMVICDTSVMKGLTVYLLKNESDSTKDIGPFRNRVPYVYWVQGYKVLAKDDIYYLDIFKRPIAKNVIVWLDQNR